MHIRLTGELLIGSRAFTGTEGFVCALDPATNQTMGPTFGLSSRADVARACELAWQAFRGFRESGLEQRAAFLERIGDNLLALGDALVERAAAESGLPRSRIEGERARTVGQLRLFAAVVREGSWMELRIDPALPDRSPAPRPGLRQRHVGVGPVAVFGASNFPLAFSVAGGDTASALAAGCPVVAKAHPAHPGTSELVGRAIQSAVAQSGLHEGVFSLLHAGTQAGQDLVAHPRIKAVGFTGSRAGGMALMAVAAAREEPIPVYAEMSSLKPVVLLPAALAGRAGDIARAFVASLTLGSGQFCTNPGLLLAQEGPGLKAFLAAAAAAVESTPAATMLTPDIFEAYGQGVDRLSAHAGVQALAQGLAGKGPHACRAALFSTPAAQFIADRALHREVFGAASLLVRCRDEADLVAVLDCLEGQLTATLHMDEADEPQARRLLPLLEEKAGRLVVNGFPTGVEVGHATVHGGPYPATSDPRSTSVGSLAIRRFLRPVCYQDMPQALLPPALRDGSRVRAWRRLDGEWVAPGAGPEAALADLARRCRCARASWA